MFQKKYQIIFLLCFFTKIGFPQASSSDVFITGHVTDNQGKHIPFATIKVLGTSIGVRANDQGHYRLTNIPIGEITLQATAVTYKPTEITVQNIRNEKLEVSFSMENDDLQLEEMVVTGNRNETKRSDSPVVVNTITPKLLNSTQSITLSDGLNFSPGVRMENNCQNCGFSQVRMNGLDGPYSQILINSRPIFSGLAGVYGLELIPTNMIERIEIIRGGGSALYGSSAIAGTINLILKDPISNTYEVGINSGLTGVGMDGVETPTSDYNATFNASLVTDDYKSGISVYGFLRDREPFDANSDDFSELSSIENITVGTRLYHRPATRNKVSLDFFHIQEERRGGNRHDYPSHMADISEAVNHKITTGAITFEQHLRDYDKLSLYFSGQLVKRDSYYGANRSLRDYGYTDDFSYVLGAQYNLYLKTSNIIAGFEQRGGRLVDQKLGYPEQVGGATTYTENTIISDQKSQTIGFFTQYEISINKLSLSAGGRIDNYNINNKQTQHSDKQNTVISPRLTIKYDIKKYLQGRLSYAQGYRSPQIFDEDLHIETSGLRKVLHTNDQDLKQETSHSYTSSLDFNKKIGSVNLGVLVEGFYTRLNDAFVNNIGEPDENNVATYTRENAESGAIVRGINIELNFIPSKNLSMLGGFTLQESFYEDAQEFNEKRFFRTPNDYGYLTLNWKIFSNLDISSTANYTGKMLVPYFGPQILNPDLGELRESPRFFDLAFKIQYSINLGKMTLQLFTGVKNIFNSYQSDFDRGIDRDPSYIYGAMTPRTIYGGIKMGVF